MKHRPLEPQRFIVMNLESPILCPLCNVVVPEGGTHECRGPVRRESREDGWFYTRPASQSYTPFGYDNTTFTEKDLHDLLGRLHAKRRPQPPPPPPPPPPSDYKDHAQFLKETAGRSTATLATGLFELAGERWGNQLDSASLNGAYRRAAHKHHPDHGGSRETFEIVVAIRDELRKRGCLS